MLNLMALKFDTYVTYVTSVIMLECSLKIILMITWKKIEQTNYCFTSEN